ncbi:translation initiation factor IF-3 [Candidatus Microgenomates bacterium]|nr:translation initiation factor IF-3 [Candidatus Microgenomates bacterium]
MKKQHLFWPSNEQIRSATLRVIDAEDKQVGVISKAEALGLAKKAGLDLVEIAGKANPPVAKIVDYGKHKYREEKKLKESLKKSKTGELKEIRFSPFIGEADYQTRMKRVGKFLKEKNKIRLVVVFKGRQMGSKQFGYNLFRKILIELGEGINADMEPKFLGRKLEMVISPTSKYHEKDKSKKEIKETSNNKD